MCLEKTSWVLKVSCLIYSLCITVSKPLARSIQEAERPCVLAAHLGDGFSTGLPQL